MSNDIFDKLNEIELDRDPDEVKLDELIDAYDPDTMNDWTLMFIRDMQDRRDEGVLRFSKRQREVVRELWEKHA